MRAVLLIMLALNPAACSRKPVPLPKDLTVRPQQEARDERPAEQSPGAASESREPLGDASAAGARRGHPATTRIGGRVPPFL